MDEVEDNNKLQKNGRLKYEHECDSLSCFCDMTADVVWLEQICMDMHF